MNRNVSDVQNQLFNLLSKGTSIQLDKFPKIKVFLSQEEFDAVNKDIIPLSQFRFGKDQIVCIYEYHGENFLVMPEIYEDISIPSLEGASDIKPIQIINYVTNCIEPLGTATEEALLQYVFTDEDVEKVEWDVILEFFPAFTMFKIKDILPVDEDDRMVYLKRLCIEAVCQTKELLQLPFDVDVINSFSAIASSLDNNIPYDNVLRSLLSYQWKFCFIDLYRCQERLLMLAWVDGFKKTMLSGLTLHDLYIAMKERYNTEHHERENMITLYSLLPQNILDLLVKALTADKKSEFIYDLRNNIVHYQRSDESVDSIKDEEWNMIVHFLLASLPCLYGKLQNCINELPEL